MRGRATVALALLSAVLGGALLVQVVAAAPAIAHAELASSDPAAGARVKTLPDVAHLRFTEVVGQPAALSVTGPDGTDIATGEVDVVDNQLSRPLDSEAELVKGTYTMSYQVTSADGHQISGTVDFRLTVGQQAQPASAPPPAAEEEGGPSTGLVVALVAGLVVALGLAVLSVGRLVGGAADA